METVENVEDVEKIPDHHYNIGFNDYYEVCGDIVAVPNGVSVPDGWELVAD